MPSLRFLPAVRGLSLVIASLTAFAGSGAVGLAASPDPTEVIEPADSLEGNFLSAYIAGASRDTAAATTFFREAIKADPRNQELLERGFVAFLADGSMTEAFRTAERLVASEPSNGLAQFALGVRSLKAKSISDCPREPRQGRPRSAGRRHRDAPHRVGLRGCRRRQARHRDRRQAEERACLQPIPRLPRRPDRRSRRQCAGGGQAVEIGL